MEASLLAMWKAQSGFSKASTCGFWSVLPAIYLSGSCKSDCKGSRLLILVVLLPRCS